MAPAPYDSTAPGPSPPAGPVMPRTRSSSLEIFTLSMGPNDMTLRPSRHMTTRPPRLMTARPSRLQLGPAMPITRSSSFKFGIPGQNPKIANSSCPSTGLSKTLYVHPLLARIEPSFGLTSRTQRALRLISQPFAPFGRFTHTPPMMYTLLHLHASSFR